MPGITSELDKALELLSEFDLEGMSGAVDAGVCEVVAVAEAVARRLSAIQVAAAAEVADRSRPELGTAGLAQRHGCVRPAALIEQIARVSGAEASRRIQLGAAVRPTVAISGDAIEPRFPELSRALAAGEVGVEAASIIVRALDGVRRVAHPEELDVAEEALVRHATQYPVQLVSDLAIAIRDRLDPDGVLPREDEARERRGITLGRESNGVVSIRGALAIETATLLKSSFDEANAPGAQPRFLSDDDRREGTETTVNEAGETVVKVRDIRTREKRQHDVLDGLLKAGIRNTGLFNGELRSTAEVVAHVSLADLEACAGVGHIDGIQESISINTVERLLCDAVFRKVVLGNDGEVLAFGKSRYPFSSAQRKAIIARDGDTCLLCDAPASWTDAHHVVPFYGSGGLGTTDVDNGVLLCSRHHYLIHHSNWQLRMINGMPHVLAPHDIDPTQTWKRVGRPGITFNRTG